MFRNCNNNNGHIIGQKDDQKQCDFFHRLPESAYVQETTKIAEIRDNFGKIRYKVFMIDLLDYYEEHEFDQRYRISVESYIYGIQPQTILVEFRKCFEEAYSFYNKCIQNYKELVIAETRDFQDIWIYADRIEYHKIDPECCATCKWSCKAMRNAKCVPCDIKHNKDLVCMNKNVLVDSQRRLPDLQPRVDNDGICKFYKRDPNKKRKNIT